jgi:hypothetical protein
MSTFLYPPGYSYSGSYTQADIDRDFGPVGWRGCIQAGKKERIVSSSGKVTKTLTDAPPTVVKWPAMWHQPQLNLKRVTTNPWWKPKKSGNGCDKATLDANPGSKCHFASYVKPQNKQCRGGDKGGCEVLSCAQDGILNYYGYPYKGFQNAWVPNKISCSSSSSNVSSGNLKTCISDPYEFEYIKKNGHKNACPWIPKSDYDKADVSQPIMIGPNIYCPTAMLGLSQSRPQIIRKLNHMYPSGATHSDVGLMWGFRMMSNRATWKNMFGYTSDTEPDDFGSKKVRKMMILLSDGLNTPSQIYKGYYGCTLNVSRGWDKPCQKSEGIAELSTDSLNDLMLDSCKAIRNSEVELYTIALDLDKSIASEADTISLLELCAGEEDRFFNIEGNELDSTFAKLANTATLRLSQ